MRTGVLVATVTATGLAGGIAGALLSGAMAPPAIPGSARTATSVAAPREEAAREVRDLPGRVQALEASLAGAGREVATLRESLAKAREETESLRARIDAFESAPADGSGGARSRGLPLFEPGMAAEGDELKQRWAAMRNRQELLRKTEEERWTAAREALGLTPQQEETLKSAIVAYQGAMKDAVTTREVTDRTGQGVVSLSIPDAERIRDARKAFDDGVGQALNAEQLRRWREEGYDGALRGGGVGATVKRAIRDRDGDGGK